jgi:hypothetical protein
MFVSFFLYRRIPRWWFRLMSRRFRRIGRGRLSYPPRQKTYSDWNKESVVLHDREAEYAKDFGAKFFWKQMRKQSHQQNLYRIWRYYTFLLLCVCFKMLCCGIFSSECH